MASKLRHGNFSSALQTREREKIPPYQRIQKSQVMPFDLYHNCRVTIKISLNLQNDKIQRGECIPYDTFRHGILHKASTSVNFWPKSFHKNSVIFYIFRITNYAWFSTVLAWHCNFHNKENSNCTYHIVENFKSGFPHCGNPHC